MHYEFVNDILSCNQLNDNVPVNLSLTLQGKYGNDEMVAVTGDVYCKYKGKAINTVWLVSGPSQMCGGGGR